jgi:hypothetical protein
VVDGGRSVICGSMGMVGSAQGSHVDGETTITEVGSHLILLLIKITHCRFYRKVFLCIKKAADISRCP